MSQGRRSGRRGCRTIKGSMSDFTAKYRLDALANMTPEESQRRLGIFWAGIIEIQISIRNSKTIQQLEEIKPQLMNNCLEWGYASEDLKSLRVEWKKREAELKKENIS